MNDGGPSVPLAFPATAAVVAVLAAAVLVVVAAAAAAAAVAAVVDGPEGEEGEEIDNKAVEDDNEMDSFIISVEINFVTSDGKIV